MAYKNSILSQEPEFYSAYDYEEQEDSDTQNVFIKVLLQLLLLLSIFLMIYFSYKYISNMDINFKKFNFWSVIKQNEPPTPKINREVTFTESSMKVKELNLKKVEVERIVKKVMKNIHKKKALEVSQTNVKPLIKSSHEQVKKPYLLDEYLEAIKKELGNN